MNNETIFITITESITEDDIDSILLSPEFMHKDIQWVFKCVIPDREKTIELSEKYGIPWEYIV
jgi:hypothetical protein